MSEYTLEQQRALALAAARARAAAASAPEPAPEESGGFLESIRDFGDSTLTALGGEALNMYEKLGLAGVGSRMAGAGMQRAGESVPYEQTERAAALEKSTALPQARAAIDQRLAETSQRSPIAGTAGQLTGTILPYLAPGEAVRKLGTKAATRFLPKSPGLSKAAGSVTEGAALGVAMARPGDELSDAGIGAAFGAALPLAGALYRGARALPGAVGSAVGNRVSDAAERILSDVDFTGLEALGAYHSLGSGFLKDFYGQVVANIPGIGNLVRDPFEKKVLPAFREGVMEKMIPPSLKANPKFIEQWDSLTGVEEKAKLLKEVWSGKGAAWAPFQSLKFNFGKNWVPMPESIRTLIDKSDFAGAKILDGQQVVSLRKMVQDRIDSLAGKGENQKEYAELLEFQEGLLDTLKKQLAPDSDQALLFEEYLENIAQKGDWNRTQKMLNAKGLDEFTPQDFHGAVKPRVGEISGELERFAKDASDVLKPFAGNPNIYASLAAIGLVGGAVGSLTGGGLGGGVTGAISTLGVTGLMAHPRVQRILVSNPNIQKAAKEAIDTDLPQDTKFELLSRILLPALISESRGE